MAVYCHSREPLSNDSGTSRTRSHSIFHGTTRDVTSTLFNASMIDYEMEEEPWLNQDAWSRYNFRNPRMSTNRRGVS